MPVAEQQVAVGNWTADKVHSSVGFAVKHLVVSTFRGTFEDYDAALQVGEDGSAKLAGTVRVASVNVKDENLGAHLQSPDFFDAERNPELRFESEAFQVAEGGELTVKGDLTIRGVTLPVSANGTYSYVAADLGGAERIGVELETVVDRTKYGLEWNAPLPKGGFALANDVKLQAHLELTPEA
jgi:polyisoprenoid-binding protein YceI